MRHPGLAGGEGGAADQHRRRPWRATRLRRWRRTTNRTTRTCHDPEESEMTRTPAPPAARGPRPASARSFADAPARRVHRSRRAGVGADQPLRWELGLRRSHDRPRAPRSQRAVRIGTTGVLLTRDDAGALPRSPTSVVTAGTSSSWWRVDGPGRRAMPLPRLELRARRGARLAPHWGRPQLRAGRHGPAAVPHAPSGVDGSSSTSMAGPARSRTTSVPSVR